MVFFAALSLSQLLSAAITQTPHGVRPALESLLPTLLIILAIVAELHYDTAVSLFGDASDVSYLRGATLARPNPFG